MKRIVLGRGAIFRGCRASTRLGRRWAVRAMGRLLRLYIKYPAARQSLKDIFDMPMDVMQQMGYGLFTGRKDK